MAHIVGCIEAHELTTCKVGANQMSHVILRKSLTPPAPTSKGKEPNQPENEDMDFAALKAVAAMNDITKGYFVTLDEEAGKAFLAKSAEDRDAEAKKAHDDAEAETKRKADEAALVEAGKTDVTKALEAVTAQNAELLKRLDERDADDAIRKTASGADFRGYPGGAETVFTMLKGMGKLDAATRDGLIAGMKATAKAGLLMGSELGQRDDAEIAKVAPATVEFNQKVAAYATEKSVSKAVATRHISEVDSALYGKVLAEQGAL